MEYKKDLAIENMRLNDFVEGFYLLQSAQVKTASNGKAFLSATLSDASGTVEAKAWDYVGTVGTKDEGDVVKIRGNITEYKGTLQLNIEKIRKACDNDVYDISKLVPTSPLDTEKAYAELLQIVNGLSDNDYKAVCLEMLKRHGDEFKKIPAAKSVHHGFLHGLLMHTLYMVKTADYLAKLYCEITDRNLLIAGTLLHDFAKIEEFTVSKLGLVSEYSEKGQLLGHLTMGAFEVSKISESLGIPEKKSILLQHMILSHHGTPEFGAAVVPMCPESELLSLIDLIDSRMEIYRESFKELPVGQFSQRIFALDKRIYHHSETEN